LSSDPPSFSALQRAEIAEIAAPVRDLRELDGVSVLFNEPKLLKYDDLEAPVRVSKCFSALQRAEIAEILRNGLASVRNISFSALQRAEIAEICRLELGQPPRARFSALQRAEIAEILVGRSNRGRTYFVSVLFNEPKLLKWYVRTIRPVVCPVFQCSSTSRNC